MRILAIGAHPDDVEFGCGATLHRLSRLGASIHLFIASSGEGGGDARVRRGEAERSARALGASLSWGEFEDAEIPLSRPLIASIESQMRLARPDVVFTHHREDSHQDHRALSQATLTAARYVRGVLFYEGPTTSDFIPSVFQDVSRDLSAKLRLLSFHKSQIHKTNIAGLCILDIARSTAVFRGTQFRVRHAEGFLPHRLSLFPQAR
jgi:LmbE family N-acetylglucosaminyl deacetylase